MKWRSLAAECFPGHKDGAGMRRHSVTYAMAAFTAVVHRTYHSPARIFYIHARLRFLDILIEPLRGLPQHVQNRFA